MIGDVTLLVICQRGNCWAGVAKVTASLASMSLCCPTCKAIVYPAKTPEEQGEAIRATLSHRLGVQVMARRHRGERAWRFSLKRAGRELSVTDYVFDVALDGEMMLDALEERMRDLARLGGVVVRPRGEG